MAVCAHPAVVPGNYFIRHVWVEGLIAAHGSAIHPAGEDTADRGPTSLRGTARGPSPRPPITPTHGKLRGPRCSRGAARPGQPALR